MTTFNGSKYVKEQIDSILNQIDIDITLVVSDDMSTDGTIDILKSCFDSRVKILPNKGKFGSASQNFFRLVRDVDFKNYDYIAFADQDDIWDLDKIKISIEVLNVRGFDAYSSNVIAFWEDGRELLIDKAQAQKKYDHLFGSAGPGCTYVFKNSLALAFKEELIRKEKLTKRIDLHDWLIYTFARENNYKWYVDSNSTMKYRQHERNEFGANSGFIAIKDRWNKARNGWYRNQILDTAKFCDIDNKIVNLLTQNRYIDKLNLLKFLFQFRKKRKEAFFLGLTLLVPRFNK
jgi:rhamnosyltransferase